MSQTVPVTQMLQSWSLGDDNAVDPLMTVVYEELRRLAERALEGERRGHTLQPTALVHEAYLRLGEQRDIQWQSRSHFFAIAAKMMRRILVDHSRRRQRKKRGGSQNPLSLDHSLEPLLSAGPDLVDLDLALLDLAALDPVKVSIVEMHFFCGFSVVETASALEMSTSTVSRQWRAAKAWLYRHLQTENGVAGSEPGD